MEFLIPGTGFMPAQLHIDGNDLSFEHVQCVVVSSKTERHAALRAAAAR